MTAEMQVLMSGDDYVVCSHEDVISSEIVELSKQTLISSNYNWFSLMNMLENQPHIDTFAFVQDFLLRLPNIGFDTHQMNLIIQSKDAYEAQRIEKIGQRRHWKV